MKTAFLTVPPGRTGEYSGRYFGPNSVIEVTALEAAALREMFGDRPFVSATKSSTGHMLAAAGSFEAVACVKMLEDQKVPGTINTETIDPDCAGINYVLGETVGAPLDYVLSNSFGFGDHNATLVFQRAV